MRGYKKLKDILKSKKAPQPGTDSLKKTTSYDKQHTRKVPHGKFYGKKWFPQ